MSTASAPLLVAWRRQRASAPLNGAADVLPPPRFLSFFILVYVISFPLTGFMLLDLASIRFGVTLSYVAMGFLFGVWPILRRRELLNSASQVRTSIALYVALVLLSVLQSFAIPTGAGAFSDKRPGVYSFTQGLYVTWALLGFAVLVEIFTQYPALRLRAMRWHVGVACFVCLWGYYQWLANFFGWTYITVFNNNIYRSELYEQSVLGLKRINSTLNEPSDYGLYLLTVIPLLLVAGKDNESFLGGKVRLIALLLSMTGLFISTSLSAYLVLFTTLLLFLATGGRWRRMRTVLTFVGVFVCFAAAAAFFSTAGGRYSLREVMLQRMTDPDNSVLERTNSAIAAVRMFAGHPLLGVGEGNFGFYYDQYSSDYNSEPGGLPRVYSLLPRVLAEHGVVGLVLLLNIFYCVIQSGWRQYSRSSLQQAILLAMLAGVIDMFMTFSEIEHFYIWFIVALVATAGASHSVQRSPAVIT